MKFVFIVFTYYLNTVKTMMTKRRETRGCFLTIMKTAIYSGHFRIGFMQVYPMRVFLGGGGGGDLSSI